MATMVCERCGNRQVWGLVSSQAWLQHRDGDGTRRWVCPTCRAELSEQQRRAFLEQGTYSS